MGFNSLVAVSISCSFRYFFYQLSVLHKDCKRDRISYDPCNVISTDVPMKLYQISIHYLAAGVAMSCIPNCANCSIDTQNCIRPLDNVCPTVHTTNVGMQSKVGSGVTEHPCLPYSPISYASNGHKILRLYPENPDIRHGHVTCRAETMGSGV